MNQNTFEGVTTLIMRIQIFIQVNQESNILKWKNGSTTGPQHKFSFEGTMALSPPISLTVINQSEMTYM